MYFSWKRGCLSVFFDFYKNYSNGKKYNALYGCFSFYSYITVSSIEE